LATPFRTTPAASKKLATVVGAIGHPPAASVVGLDYVVTAFDKHYSAGSLSELNAAIAAFDSGRESDYTIDLTADISVAGSIQAITLAGGSLQIHGDGHGLNGGLVGSG